MMVVIFFLQVTGRLNRDDLETFPPVQGEGREGGPQMILSSVMASKAVSCESSCQEDNNSFLLSHVSVTNRT